MLFGCSRALSALESPHLNSGCRTLTRVASHPIYPADKLYPWMCVSVRVRVIFMMRIMMFLLPAG